MVTGPHQRWLQNPLNKHASQFYEMEYHDLEVSEVGIWMVSTDSPFLLIHMYVVKPTLIAFYMVQNPLLK